VGQLLVLGAMPTLVKQATEDTHQDARKKAILALSSGVRNYQPSLDTAMETIPKEHLPEGKVDAGEMEAVDGIISSLRASSAKKG
jgi:hsp70-interacting protein